MASIQYKKNWIRNTLARYENSGVTNWREMDRIADTICWLWKFRHITKEEKDEMCDKATAIFERGW